jgi:hypothetical protein
MGYIVNTEIIVLANLRPRKKISLINSLHKTKLYGLSQRANYTDRATSAYLRS